MKEKKRSKHRVSLATPCIVTLLAVGVGFPNEGYAQRKRITLDESVVSAVDPTSGIVTASDPASNQRVEIKLGNKGLARHIKIGDRISFDSDTQKCQLGDPTKKSISCTLSKHGAPGSGTIDPVRGRAKSIGSMPDGRQGTPKTVNTPTQKDPGNSDPVPNE